MINNENQFKNFIRGIKFDDTVDPNHRDKLEQDLLLATAKTDPRQKDSSLKIWRIIMRSQITKVAAAAVIVIAVVLSLTFLEKSVAPAYAIEQTIEVNHTVRYLHIKSFDAEHENEPKEFWVEFYEDGQVKNVRMHMPEWDSPSDGAKVVVWKENKAQVYLKRKNILATIRDKRVAAEILKFIETFDPGLAVKRLDEQEDQGEVEIQIDEPTNKAEPIVVTATALPESSTPGRRAVLFVDQATKLVTAIELYRLKEGEYEYENLIEYYDYNQPIDPKMFSLDEDAIPADVMRIDQTTQKIGLVQGNLTDKEIAVKVVREFYEALIAKDYAKAGRLYSGVPADKIRERWKELNVVGIISIGEPVPHPTPGVGGFQVPCKIEVEKDGVKSVYEPYGPGVRPVHGQPERWNIHGGVK